MASLDIGCGCKPHGSVNCDLYPQKTVHRSNFETINAEHIPNFVRCDGQHLPFKDSCFSLVFSDSVIEHVDNPGLMLKEMIRVSSGKVVVKAPHRMYLRKRQTRKQHKHYFSKAWFAQQFKALKAFGWEIIYSRVQRFPVYFFGFSFPQEITATCWVQKC